MERLRGVGGTDPVGEGRLHCRTSTLPPRSVRAVLAVLPGPRYLWAPPDEPTFAGSGRAIAISAADGYAVDSLMERIESVFANRVTTSEYGDETPSLPPGDAMPRMFGGLSFHSDVRPGEPWSSFPAASFVVPRVSVAWRDDELVVGVAEYTDGDPESRLKSTLDEVANRLIELPEPGSEPTGPGVSRLIRQTSRKRWRSQVQRAVDRIQSGDLEKVVIAQSKQALLEGSISLPDVIARLARSYPQCRRFCFEQAPGVTFFGATPERLVTKRDRTVDTEALAGSTGRGDTPQEDEWLADELGRSAKDLHEHRLVRDAIVDQLDPVAESITTDDRTVRQLATVQHLQTSINAVLNRDVHVLELVDALHPTPAVGGLPPNVALETIKSTETFDRGWYAGPVGWVDANGNGSFAVAIRSALATEDQAALFAGAGIVSDSDPDREWDEVQLKYRPILDALV